MNAKILIASFSLVFLAELGDKTQLTALAFATSSRSPWSVFLGTSLALICTTALAVLCGEMLSRAIPERILQLVSAVMFVLVGLVLLVNLARKGPVSVPEGPAAVPVDTSGPLSVFVGRQAAAFEEDLAAFIRENAHRVGDAAARARVLSLEASHRAHARALSGLGAGATQEEETLLAEEMRSGRAGQLLGAMQVSPEDGGCADVVSEIIDRQEAAAEFYIALAKLIRFHDSRDLLRDLAMEEIRLAQEVCAVAHHPDPNQGSAS